MKFFRTHLIVSANEATKIGSLTFKDTELLTYPEPSNCFWESGNGSEESYYRNGKSAPQNETKQLELIIGADSKAKAEDVLSLIHGGIMLAYPEPYFVGNFVTSREYNKKEDSLYKSDPFRKYFKRIEHIEFGCLVAQKAIGTKEMIYAIEKYKTSLKLFSTSPKLIDPTRGLTIKQYNEHHKIHVQVAFAIIAGFSVIEELGLEVRSSRTNPRFTDPGKGEWNKQVLHDIKKRLAKIGVDEKDTIDWTYRGTPTKIEQKIKPLFGNNSEWVNYGNEVRDKTLTFPEAIHNASYLRNYFSAHKYTEMTQYLNPYDVFNVQDLSRQLILRKLELWKTTLNKL